MIWFLIKNQWQKSQPMPPPAISFQTLQTSNFALFVGRPCENKCLCTAKRLRLGKDQIRPWNSPSPLDALLWEPEASLVGGHGSCHGSCLTPCEFKCLEQRSLSQKSGTSKSSGLIPQKNPFWNNPHKTGVLTHPRPLFNCLTWLKKKHKNYPSIVKSCQISICCW